MPKSKILCMDNIVFMRNCKDKEFDVAVVDPEYLDKKSNIKVEGTEGGRMLKKGTTFEDFNGKPTDEYFYHLFRISKDQIIFGGNYFTDIMDYSKYKETGNIEDINPYLKSNNNWFVWNKQIADANWSMYELAWVSINNNARSYRCSPMNSVANWHPTSKPIDVYRYIYESYITPLKKKLGRRISVIDTNLGSGSSAIAAFFMDIDFTGIEINRKFYDLFMIDFDNYKKKNALFLPIEEIDEFEEFSLI